MDKIYLQKPDEDSDIRTWCEDRLNEDDEKFINIKAIINKFKKLVNDRGLCIPSMAIRKAVDELENL